MAINLLTNFNFPAIINTPSANPNPCPDQLIGQLSNGVFSANPVRINIDYINNSTIFNTLTNPIIIILESPHINEYNSKGQALGPAIGKTGKNFNKYFNSIISTSEIHNNINYSTHDVVFVNAVQYQCSLGNPLNGKGTYQNKKLRDENWLTCFNGNGTNDLYDRIKAINPSAVINLCTIGLRNLQLYVDRKLNSFKNYTIGNHPSTWIYGRGLIQ